MTMGRRRLRCTLLLAFGFSMSCMLMIYMWPFDSSDHLDPVSLGIRPTSWIFPWQKSRDMCKLSNFPPPRDMSVMDTGKMYESLDFEVEPGTTSFWNKTFEEKYLQWKKTKRDDLPLEVIVVPISHIDPGWLRTYDEYYNGYVVPILDNMVNFLNKTPEFTFIWSEISYFSMWWKDLTPETKQTVKKLLRRRQLEIVTGGWVMADEATSHYWSIIDQMVEGHQFLKAEPGILPSYASSVDVFGHSSTMPTLLSAAGIKGMVILRVHYAWRAFLASSQALDFSWDTEANSFIRCHMAPSDLYSIKHACGPDPKACLQFDFRKISDEYSESIATSITSENIKPKAHLLLSQYERYASLYPHNVLLVPLGDDFRYNYQQEWEQQYQNYKKLFDFINNSKENAHVRFGTIADYFEEVSRRIQDQPRLALPSIRGDFLPYADIYASGVPAYWTGFYTSRPFAKALARELEHWLRSAEILYSFSLPCISGKDRKKAVLDYSQLMSARHSLAIFHHHDAITGTSKYFVMEDYIRRLHAGINEAMTVLTHAAQHLLMPPTEKNVQWTSKIFLDSVRTHPETMTKKTSIHLTPKGRKVVIFNSLTFHRREIVRIKVKTLYVDLLDSEGKKVVFQINPVWNGTAHMMTNEYELLFVCDIGPLSFKTFTVVSVPEEEWNSASRADVSLYIADNSPQKSESAFLFKKQSPSDIELESESVKVKFSEKGLPKHIYLRNHHIEKPIDLNFYVHSPKPHLSGAYLFSPFEGGTVPLQQITDTHPITRIVKGPLVSEVSFSQAPLMTVTTRIYHFSGALDFLDVDISFDISRMNPGVELVTRIKSSINNEGVFHTDSNGLNMKRRKRVSKLPIQGNYYPITSASYIEDTNSRLNLFCAQSHGFTSPSDGVLEVMLDRRIEHDDLRGLSEGLLDNKLTTSKFRLLLEEAVNHGSTPSALTPTGHVTSRTLLYPLTVLVVDSPVASLLSHRFSLAKKPWPLGVHLVNLKTLPPPEDFYVPGTRSLLITANHRVSCDVDSNPHLPNHYDIGKDLVNVIFVEKTSLTGVSEPVINPNEFEVVSAYNVAFSAG